MTHPRDNSPHPDDTRPAGGGNPDHPEHRARDEADRFAGCLLGLATGDALGTAVEFRPRGSFPPVRELTGGGPFHLPPGAWTDDTAMALCLAESLLASGGHDPRDQMRRYVRWWTEGHLSSTGTCFDIGNTVRLALASYRLTDNPLSGPTDENTAGNGSIMRLAPIPMFYHPDRAAAIEMSGASSRTTHGAPACVEACRLLGAILHLALAGADKESLLSPAKDMQDLTPTQPGLAAIARGDYRDKSADQVRGSGYVVDSLEAALWSFHVTDSFADAVRQAANLGDDADTTAAICGQVAGAYYGLSGIPSRWVKKMVMRPAILRMAEGLRQAVSPTLPG